MPLECWDRVKFSLPLFYDGKLQEGMRLVGKGIDIRQTIRIWGTLQIVCPEEKVCLSNWMLSSDLAWSPWSWENKSHRTDGCDHL